MKYSFNFSEYYPVSSVAFCNQNDQRLESETTHNEFVVVETKVNKEFMWFKTKSLRLVWVSIMRYVSRFFCISLLRVNIVIQTETRGLIFDDIDLDLLP